MNQQEQSSVYNTLMLLVALWTLLTSCRYNNCIATLSLLYFHVLLFVHGRTKPVSEIDAQTLQ